MNRHGIWLAFFLLVLFSIRPSFSYADDKRSLPALTVINQIRGNELGLDGVNLLNSLRGQWVITKKLGIHATWLWQYSALEKGDLITYAKREMRNQEFGIFLEVDRNFAVKSHVGYRGRGPWYFSDGLFLFSYDTAERKKLIDTDFTLFKQKFGYYPKTVGSWWLTSDTLKYMHDKYGVIAALRAADQFNLDAYSIWGTPWSIPYISSRTNAGIPASGPQNTADVVIMQWAARDPLEGYGRDEQSTYSLQDYTLHQRDSSYFKYLVENYLKGPFDQVVIGYESGAAPQSYEGAYKERLGIAMDLAKDKKLSIESASEFSQRFLAKGVAIQRPYILTTGYHIQDQAFWYMSPFMRVGIQKKGDIISLVDFRDYTHLDSGEYNILPNSQGFLRIDTPALIDSARFPGQQKVLAKLSGKLDVTQQQDRLIVKVGNRNIVEITPNSLNILANQNVKKEKIITIAKTDSSQIMIEYFGVIYFLYIVFLIYKREKTSFNVWDITLILPFVVFCSSMLQVNNGILFLDKKQLIFSPLLTIFQFTIFTRLVFVFFIVPFTIFLLAHFFLLLRNTTRVTEYMYGIIFLLVAGIFVHLPYFPLDRSTYLIVGLILSCFGALCLGIILVIYKKTKSQKLAFLATVTSGILFIFIVILLVFSRSVLVITSRDIDALTAVAKQKMPVSYILPTQEPIYKKYKPVMYEDYSFVRYLISSSWNIVQVRDLPDNSSLVVAPRYIGADFSDNQAQKMQMKKIFDNADFVIYRK